MHAPGLRSEEEGHPWADVQQPHGRSEAHRDVNITLRSCGSQTTNLMGLRIIFMLELAPSFEDLLTRGMDVEGEETRR